jgi:hypothetical protein
LLRTHGSHERAFFEADGLREFLVFVLGLSVEPWGNPLAAPKGQF